MIAIASHLDLLGKKVEDRVTGCRGVVTSICFDLFGCVQGLVYPICRGGEVSKDSGWFDTMRLKVTDQQPVMDRPDFVQSGMVALGEKGPENKPIPSRY